MFNSPDQGGGIRKLGQYMQLSFAMVRYKTVRVFRTRHPLSGGSAVSIHVGYSSTTRQGVQFGLLVAADAEKSYWKDLVSEKKACLSSKHEFPSIRDLVKSHRRFRNGEFDRKGSRWSFGLDVGKMAELQEVVG